MPNLPSISDRFVGGADIHERKPMRNCKSGVAGRRPLSDVINGRSLSIVAHRVDQNVSDIDVSSRERVERVRWRRSAH